MNALLRQKKNKDRVAVGNSLKHLQDAQSALNDLIYSIEILDYIMSRDEHGDERWISLPAAMTGSVFAQSILLYVRATEPGSQRKSIRIIRQLSENQRVIHKRLCNLRDKVIAHLDRDRSFGNKSFADERLVLVHNGDGQHRIQLADMRLTYNEDLALEFRELLSQAFNIFCKVVSGRENETGRLLGELSKSDQEIVRLIEVKKFDAENFFGDINSAHIFLTQGSVGVDHMRSGTMFYDWPDASDR